ncbi:MAG: PfkB family carbohydrate kinase [Ktedonobacterales bacterium]
MRDDTPDLLLIGHVTRDLLPDGGWRLGGTATYAAATARRLGLRPAIVTSGPADIVAALQATLPDVPTAVVPSDTATTFENRYMGGVRRQFLRARAAPLGLADVPLAWRRAPVALLAPLADEVAPALAAAFPGALVAATPQGWLRRWDARGQVYSTTLPDPSALLPYLGALILSREDLAPSPTASMTPADVQNVASTTGAADAATDALLAGWARLVPLLVVTLGAAGALLYRAGAAAQQAFPGYPAREVDPTGAGDVFAAALLVALHAGRPPDLAVDFANRVAALSVEREGVAGIPTLDDLRARYGDIAQ